MSTALGYAARLVTVLLLGSAIVASAASAGRFGPEGARPQHASEPIATCHQYCGAARTGDASALARPDVVRTELVQRSQDGFDWSAAAIGFGVAVVLGASGLLVLGQLPGRRARIGHAGSRS